MSKVAIISDVLNQIKEKVKMRKIRRQIVKVYSINCNMFKLKSPDILSYFQKMEEVTKNTTYSIFHEPEDKIQTFEGWAWGQYRIFCWVSIFYSMLKGKDSSKLDPEQISLISYLFNHKERQFIQYSLIKLIKENQKRVDWLVEEQRIFRSIVENQQHIDNWALVSFEMFRISNHLYFKSPEKCRLKWSNYFNPKMNKEKWTQEQDIFLFQLVLKHGLKWCVISKEMKDTRNNHMVKNRYKSLTKKFSTPEDMGQNLTKITQKVLKSYLKAINNKEMENQSSSKCKNINKSDNLKKSQSQHAILGQKLKKQYNDEDLMENDKDDERQIILQEHFSEEQIYQRFEHYQEPNCQSLKIEVKQQDNYALNQSIIITKYQ